MRTVLGGIHPGEIQSLIRLRTAGLSTALAVPFRNAKLPVEMTVAIGILPPNCLPCHAMARETLVDSRQEILRTAARLFQQRGYDATSMNDVAAALKLSKGGLYHHFQSKDEILFEIMNHAMEITQER